jgi:hypothetical protein
MFLISGQKLYICFTQMCDMKTLPAIFVISLITLLIACGKDKYETKPRLEIKSYSSREIFKGEDLRISINYFDKEGDLNKAPVIGIKKRLNLLPLGSGSPDLQDTFDVLLPDYPAKDKGEITFQLGHDRLQESVTENDTVVFLFAVTDLAGNKSDTVTSDQIVLHKQ